MITTVHNKSRHIHRNSSSYQFLAGHKQTGKVVPKSMSVSQSRPTIYNTSHHFHDQGKSCKRATVQTVPSFTSQPSCVTSLQGKSGALENEHPAQNCSFLTSLTIQFLPIVIEASGAMEIGNPAGKLLTAIRIPLEAHLWSNTSPSQVCHPSHGAKEHGSSFVPGNLDRRNFQRSTQQSRVVPGLTFNNW